VIKPISRFLQCPGGTLASAITASEEGDMRRSAVAAAVTTFAIATTLATATAFAVGEQRFPQGRYASPLTAADFTRYGGHMDANFPHPWIITIRRGRWHTNEDPAFGGSYLLRGNVITFVVKSPADAAGTRQALRWTFSQRRLRFRIVSGVEGGDQAIYLAHPWRWLGK
jgi:hypothetical protein